MLYMHIHIASIMKDVKTENTTIVFNNNDYKFKTTGQVIKFDGYLPLSILFKPLKISG